MPDPYIMAGGIAPVWAVLASVLVVIFVGWLAEKR